MQVLPTAPSPTVTHFMNLEALIFFLSFFQLQNPNGQFLNLHIETVRD